MPFLLALAKVLAKIRSCLVLIVGIVVAIFKAATSPNLRSCLFVILGFNCFPGSFTLFGTGEGCFFGNPSQVNPCDNHFSPIVRSANATLYIDHITKLNKHSTSGNAKG